jgi:hypothetical protein
VAVRAHRLNNSPDMAIADNDSVKTMNGARFSYP